MHTSTLPHCHEKHRANFSLSIYTCFACERGRLSTTPEQTLCIFFIFCFNSSHIHSSEDWTARPGLWTATAVDLVGHEHDVEGAWRPGWMVRGQKEERGDQMCFPDKITLVPAPLIQNTHRYQLAQGTRGVCQPLHGQQVELVSVCEYVCVSVAVYIFADAQNKGCKKNKTNMQQRINNTCSSRWWWIIRTAYMSAHMDSYEYKGHLFQWERSSSSTLSPVCCYYDKVLILLPAISRNTQWIYE